MDSSDSIDNSWDSSSDQTTTAMRSDPMASEKSPLPPSSGWMVNVAGRDIVELSYADVMAKWRSGELNGSTLVWREGMENWAKLESVPAFQVISKPESETDEPTTAGRNFFPVYERPAATLIFDEEVEAEWKGTPKAPEPSETPPDKEPSKRTRSVNARPPAPSLPPLGPRRSPVVPADEAPPPPPLPPRKQSAPPKTATRPPQQTIPGGLMPPTPPPPSVAPGSGGASPARAVMKSSSPPAATAKSSSPPAATAKSSSPPAAAAKSSSPPAVVATPANSPLPPPPNSASPLLLAITAAASSPEPVVQAPPAVVIPDEASDIAPFKAMKSVSFRSAALACAGSALLASLVTSLVVGSGSKQVERRPAEPQKVTTVATVAPSPQPPAAAPEPAPPPPAAPEPAKVEKVAASEPEAEKPKPKPVKVSSYKPPTVAALPAEPTAGEADKLAPNPDRDDPMRAVPDRVDERTAAEPATSDPGF